MLDAYHRIGQIAFLTAAGRQDARRLLLMESLRSFLPFANFHGLQCPLPIVALGPFVGLRASPIGIRILALLGGLPLVLKEPGGHSVSTDWFVLVRLNFLSLQAVDALRRRLLVIDLNLALGPEHLAPLLGSIESGLPLRAQVKLLIWLCH